MLFAQIQEEVRGMPLAVEGKMLGYSGTDCSVVIDFWCRVTEPVLKGA